MRVAGGKIVEIDILADPDPDPDPSACAGST